MNFSRSIRRIVFALLSATCAPLAWGDEQRHHDAHEHGMAKLNIAQEGRLIRVELNSPAANIVGYEHLPESDKEYETLRKALTVLKDGSDLFRFPESAGCDLSQADISTPLMNPREEGHAKHGRHADEPSPHHRDEHGHDGVTHADINGIWDYDCEHPAKIDQLDVRLFEAFPDITRLQVQFINEKGQGARVLDASQSTLRF